jgi:hypothetical protein
MFAAAFAILRPLLPYLICAAIAGGAYLWADFGWCNGACRSAKSATVKQEARAVVAEGKLAELDRQRIAQQEQWAQATAAEEQREKLDADKRKQVFAGLKDRARHPGAGSGAAVSDPSRKLLGDAFAAAEAAQAPGGTDTAAPADSETLGDLIVWSVDILDWAATCRATVEGWQKWYSAISGAGSTPQTLP